jgi:SAM-dependent methyltransferase
VEYDFIDPVSSKPLRRVAPTDQSLLGLRPRSSAYYLPDTVEISSFLLNESETDGEFIAYPCVGDVPLLMQTESWVGENAKPITDGHVYTQVYGDIAHYNDVASGQIGADSDSNLEFLRALSRKTSTAETEEWIDADFDRNAQFSSLIYLRGAPHGDLLQIGGSGTHALKFAVVDSRRVILATPILAEAEYFLHLASSLGVRDLVDAVVALAEHLPIKDGSIGASYSHGSMHHTQIEAASSEIRRVLQPGGRFAAVEPLWTPLYKVGIRTFGKRDPHVGCTPLAKDRIAQFEGVWPKARIERSGALVRYPLLAGWKLGVKFSPQAMRKLFRIDGRIVASCPPLSILGGSGALLAEREPA